MSQPEFTLLGDAVWLDFINTARGRSAAPQDLLPDAVAFARWSHTQRLDGLGEASPHALVLRFRGELIALAEALHEGRVPPPASISAINIHLAQNPGTDQLTRIAGEWRLRFAPDRRPGVLQAIARSAAETLAERRLRVRQCAGEACSLFILDSTPNRSRLWCSPAVCGRDHRVERRRGLLR